MLTFMNIKTTWWDLLRSPNRTGPVRTRLFFNYIAQQYPLTIENLIAIQFVPLYIVSNKLSIMLKKTKSNVCSSKYWQRTIPANLKRVKIVLNESIAATICRRLRSLCDPCDREPLKASRQLSFHTLCEQFFCAGALNHEIHARWPLGTHVS